MFVIISKVVQMWDCESFESQVRNESVVSLSHKVRNKEVQYGLYSSAKAKTKRNQVKVSDPCERIHEKACKVLS